MLYLADLLCVTNFQAKKNAFIEVWNGRVV